MKDFIRGYVIRIFIYSSILEVSQILQFIKKTFLFWFQLEIKGCKVVVDNKLENESSLTNKTLDNNNIKTVLNIEDIKAKMYLLLFHRFSCQLEFWLFVLARFSTLLFDDNVLVDQNNLNYIKNSKFQNKSLSVLKIFEGLRSHQIPTN